MPEPTLLIGIVLIAALAFANGSNDVSKGVATLVGSGVSDYHRAIRWGAVWTVVGGLLGIYFSTAMVKTFTNGILSNATGGIPTPLAIPVILGAMGWVFLASKTGMPVSTTHAITGALCGVGLVALGPGGIQWVSLIHKVVLPLAFSPLLAFGLAFLFFPILRRCLAGWRGHCFCILPAQKAQLAVEQNGLVRIVPAQTELVTVMNAPQCEAPHVLSLRIGPDSFHWLTSGMTSLARGLNDAPKMVVLLTGLSLLSADGSFSLMTIGFAAVALGMGLGSYFGGRKVTEVLAEKVTRMDHIEGFSANLTTALLVIFAARFGLPVSTTHVSSSAIIGVGLQRGLGQVNWRTAGEMVLAWAVTLPAAGLLSAGCYLLSTRI